MSKTWAALRPADAARDADRLAGGELPVHRRRGDADALLAARLLQPVELRAVEQLAEDLRHLRLDDARGRCPARPRRSGPRPSSARRPASRPRGARSWTSIVQLGQDAGLLAGVERVVDGFLDRGEERLRGVVEAEQVAVLDEELGDRDLALLLRQRLGGDARGRPSAGSAGVSSSASGRAVARLSAGAEPAACGCAGDSAARALGPGGRGAWRSRSRSLRPRSLRRTDPAVGRPFFPLRRAFAARGFANSFPRPFGERGSLAPSAGTPRVRRSRAARRAPPADARCGRRAW